MTCVAGRVTRRLGHHQPEDHDDGEEPQRGLAIRIGPGNCTDRRVVFEVANPDIVAGLDGIVRRLLTYRCRSSEDLSGDRRKRIQDPVPIGASADVG